MVKLRRRKNICFFAQFHFSPYSYNFQTKYSKIPHFNCNPHGIHLVVCMLVIVHKSLFTWTTCTSLSWPQLRSVLGASMHKTLNIMSCLSRQAMMLNVYVMHDNITKLSTHVTSWESVNHNITCTPWPSCNSTICLWSESIFGQIWTESVGTLIGI